MAEQISVSELNKLKKDDYILIDVREAAAYNHGYIPHAISMELKQLEAMLVLFTDKQEDLAFQSYGDRFQEELEKQLGQIIKEDRIKEKKIILYCAKGILTAKPAEKLQALGYMATHLEGGYIAWLKDNFAKAFAKEAGEASGDKTKLNEAEEEEHAPAYLEIEKSLRKKFKRSLFSPFAKAINTYELMKEGDKIAVCISGGKDSMLMAKLFQELKRHNKFHFEVVFMIMDPGYSPENREIILNNCRLLNIPYTIFESDIFDSVFQVDKSPCYLCARMRRGYLYSKAKELGCNKIALGHHYDDVIETILMGMVYGAQVQTMMPKLHSTNFAGMELIRPMYFIREADIHHWRDYNKLYFIQCACRFTDTCTITPDSDGTGSKRAEIKNWIKEMKKVNPFVEANIFKSVENVNLDTVVAYKAKGVRHHFLEEYDI